MAMPSEYQRASDHFHDFLIDARDAAGLETTDATDTMVQRVLCPRYVRPRCGQPSAHQSAMRRGGPSTGSVAALGLPSSCLTKSRHQPKLSFHPAPER
jgi:hypothetical protein